MCSLDEPTHILLPGSRAASFQFSYLIDVVSIGMSHHLCKSPHLRQDEQAGCKASPQEKKDENNSTAMPVVTAFQGTD